MKTFWLNNRKCEMPQSWSECTPTQIVNGLMAQLKCLAETRPERKAHWQIMMIRALAKAPGTMLNLLTGEQVQALLRMCDWAFTSKLKHRPFESFKCNDVEYFLPAENFADTTAVELAMASIYYLQFSSPNRPNTRAGLQLMATLCRPKRRDYEAFRASTDWNGDVREEYNQALAEERVDLFGTLPLGYLIALLQYFEHMHTKFLERYGEVFGSKDDDSDKEPLYKNGEGWIAILEEVAEIGSHGTFKQVCAENCHTIFLFLKHRTARQERIRQEQEEYMEQNRHG